MARQTRKVSILDVEAPKVMSIKKYNLTEEAADVIEQYAKFMSERKGTAITADSVVESLSQTLHKISEFNSWRKK